ncbi:MAG: MFS transporter [Acidimicrobiia bacterium]|nr:MFS transporter [Acidimicrobiia bacterium]
MTAPVASPSGSRDPRKPWAPTAFTRLARTHATNVGADAMFALAMAGTVFFSVTNLDEARERTALLLVFTIAPFALAAPIIGPLLDRAKGGRRWMIIALAVARAVLCVLLIRHADSWLFFPEGLLVLVMSRGYNIARGAVVPTTVRSDEELVQANAKLSLLGGLSAAVAAAPAGLLLWLGGPSWVLALAAITFAASGFLATQMPKVRIADEPVEEAERRELRSIGIILAASSMGLIRAIAGFLLFLLAFYSKDNDLPVLLGVAAVLAQLGFVGGAVTAPSLRRRLGEEHIVMAALSLIIGAGLVCAAVVSTTGSVGVLVGAGVASLFVGLASSIGKQAFDAIVQRDAPDANRGRTFARFEARFQLVWVLGGLVPTAIGVPLELSFVGISALATFALVSYSIGRKRAARGDDHRLIKVPRPNVSLPDAAASVTARMRRGELRRAVDEARADEKGPRSHDATPPTPPGRPSTGARRRRRGRTPRSEPTRAIPGRSDPSVWGPAGTLPPALSAVARPEPPPPPTTIFDDDETPVATDEAAPLADDAPAAPDGPPASPASSGVEAGAGRSDVLLLGRAGPSADQQTPEHDGTAERRTSTSEPDEGVTPPLPGFEA